MTAPRTDCAVERAWRSRRRSSNIIVRISMFSLTGFSSSSSATAAVGSQLLEQTRAGSHSGAESTARSTATASRRHRCSAVSLKVGVQQLVAAGEARLVEAQLADRSHRTEFDAVLVLLAAFSLRREQSPTVPVMKTTCPSLPDARMHTIAGAPCARTHMRMHARTNGASACHAYHVHCTPSTATTGAAPTQTALPPCRVHTRRSRRHRASAPQPARSRRSAVRCSAEICDALRTRRGHRPQPLEAAPTCGACAAAAAECTARRAPAPPESTFRRSDGRAATAAQRGRCRPKPTCAAKRV